MTYRRILCATDFHDGSGRALGTAAGLARRFGGELTLIHVVHEPRMGWPGPWPEARYAAAIAGLAGHTLADWKRRAEVLRGGPVAAHLLEGVAWQRIVEQAKAGGHDLVVVGARGHGSPRRDGLGSVAERVARHAPCAVLVVQGDSDAPAGTIEGAPRGEV